MIASSPAIHATIPPIFHGIVASAAQTSRNLSPSLAHLCDHLFDEYAFVGRDWVMVEVGLEVLMESLATLLWAPRLQRSTYANPVTRPVKLHQAHEILVLVG